MKRFGKKFKEQLVILVLFFGIIIIGFNLGYHAVTEQQTRERNVVVNRLNHELETLLENQAVEEQNGQDTDYYRDTELSEDGRLQIITNFIENKMDEWRLAYGTLCPAEAVWIPARKEDSAGIVASSGKDGIICALYSSSGEIYGFVDYRYEAGGDGVILLVNGILVLCFGLMIGYLIFVYKKILEPFHALSEYPERLARLRTVEKLPESKSRFFGKYIWGMNMLCDQLALDREKLARAEYERQTLLASIAHGVKTPVANIRLYAAAIKEGLYEEHDRKDRKENINLQIADKIDANAVKIETLTAELLETSATAIRDYEPEIEAFYMKELEELLQKEYSDRLRLSRIPYQIICEGNPMLISDKWGLFRVLSQLLENAIKYGDGTGIVVTLLKREDGFYFSVRNKGELLPEQELPFIFRSYWRGSNAEGKKGSGIGLYTASEIMKSLGGSVNARRLEASSEMEFVVYLEM